MLLPYVLFVLLYVGSYLLIQEFESWITGVFSPYVISLCDFAYYVVGQEPAIVGVCCSVVIGTLVGVFVFSVMWSSVYKCHRVECAFISPVRTECGMFVMYCMQCCPCQLFGSAWMWRLEEVYICLLL